jgi:hypothetical protein
MLDKTEQSDRAANPNEKPENCLRGPAEGFRPVSTLLYAMAGRPETPILPAPVIREKSQFRAQDDSLALSPCSCQHQPLSTLPSLGPPFSLGRPIFRLSVHAGAKG